MKNRVDSTILELLRQVDIFSTLQRDELISLIPFCEFLEYSVHDLVFKKGDPGNALFVIETGEVVIQTSDEEASQEVTQIARFLDGNGFGELDLFSEEPRKADAMVVKPTRLLRFPAGSTPFSTFLEDQPDLSARILHRILIVVNSRIRRANELVKENSPLVQELKKQVYRDKLTGIYNQNYLVETIRSKITKEKAPFALLISKPDNFKDLNDQYGHEAGDRAIRLMARKLRTYVGDDHRVARFKGNAMAVILQDADRAKALEKAREVKTFLNQIDLSEMTGANPFRFSTSIGIGFFPENSSDAEELINQTHELPLIARKQGGGRILFHDSDGESS